MLPAMGASALMGGGMTGGAGGSAGPSAARGGEQGGSSYDGSGFNVVFGGGDIDSQRAQTPLADLGGVMAYLPYIAIGVLALVLWKKKKKA